MATHSSIFAWEIPQTEEPGWLQSMGLQRAGHDWARTHKQLNTLNSKGGTVEVDLPPSPVMNVQLLQDYLLARPAFLTAVWWHFCCKSTDSNM